METYIVRPGDTLFIIARQHGIPLEQLIRANPQLTNPNVLQVGEIINIPALAPPPEQLDVINSTAEEIIDDAYLGNWDRALSKVNIIRTNMNEVTPLLQEAAVPDLYINRINTAINSLEENLNLRRTNPAISQANQITQVIPDILDYFAVILPTDLRRLRYLGRQIIVNVSGNDWTEANNNYQRARRVWGRLSLELGPKYAFDIASFDQILASLGRALNRQNNQEAIDATGRMLKAIGVIENNFIEQLA